VKDFSIEKSFESFCTDSSMRSNYDEKLVESVKFAKENEEKKKQGTPLAKFANLAALAKGFQGSTKGSSKSLV